MSEAAPSRAPETSPVRACPMCGSAGSAIVFASRDLVYGVPGEFMYRRCRACGSVYQDPGVVARDLSMCYPPGYYTHEISERQTEWVFSNLSGHDLLRSEGARRRALDIGCGNGDAVLALNRMGWRAEGIEPDSEAARIAGERAGVTVRAGDFLSSDFDGGGFHLVMLRHVIEHMHDPAAVMNRVAGLLAPEGRAVLWYPNPRSLGGVRYGRFWVGWDPPRHLVLPSPSSLVAAAESAGLRTLHRSTSAKYTDWSSALSRILRAGRRIDLPSVRPGVEDRLFARAERILVALGFDVGDEVNLAFEKPS